MDIESLHNQIRSALPLDSEAQKGQLLAEDKTDTRWSFGQDGLLRLDDRIYVPNHSDLRLQVLRYFHDHPLSGHFGQNRTLDAIRRQYVWPKIREFVRDYVSSCTTCGRNKSRRH